MNITKMLSVAALATVVMVGAGTAEAYDRNVSLINHSNVAIVYIYTSPSHSGRWGPDQLGYSILGPGEELYLHVNGNEDTGTCYFDVKAVTEYGEEVFDWEVDFCSVSEIAYY